MTNLNTAFDVAEKYLDIPKMLDAEGEKKNSPHMNILELSITSSFKLTSSLEIT